MSVVASALYGSRARNDHHPKSDVDLLMVTTESRIKHSIERDLSVSFYPLSDLRQRAKAGDLFLCHILLEGKILYDSDGIFDNLNSVFNLRDSYALEKNHARDIAWMILKFHQSIQDSPIFGRRLTWCARTLIIAESAERGRPVFAAKELAEIAPEIDVSCLLRQKDSPVTAGALDELKKLFTKFNLLDPLPNATSVEEFAARFEETDNTLGNNFICSSGKNISDYT